MKASTKMIRALAGMERAMVALAAEHAAYEEGVRALAREAYDGVDVRHQGDIRQAEVTSSVGTQRLDALLAGRLLDLGLEGFVGRGSAKRTGEEWVQLLTTLIERVAAPHVATPRQKRERVPGFVTTER